jgi:hypothetical protein
VKHGEGELEGREEKDTHNTYWGQELRRCQGNNKCNWCKRGHFRVEVRSNTNSKRKEEEIDQQKGGERQVGRIEMDGLNGRTRKKDDESRR